MSKDVASSSEMKPIDFSKQWDMSDVAIRPLNGDLLYVNKIFMAIHSPYFKGLFFSEFQESKKDIVDMEIEYDMLLEILQIIHQQDRKFVPEGLKEYSLSDLTELYHVSDKFDIPLIRDLCRQQVVRKGTKEAFEIAVQLGLKEEKSKILDKLNLESTVDYVEYFNTRNAGDIFSAADVISILEKTGIFQAIECARCSNSSVMYIDASYYCHKCRCRWI